MIHVKRKNLRIYLVVVIFSVIGFLPVHALLKLVIAMLQLVVIISRSKVSFFSIFTVLINFCFIQQYIAYTGEVYGLLEVSGIPIYYNELCICTYCFNLIMLGFLLFTTMIKNEKKLFSDKVQFGKNISIFMLILALILTFLIFPSFPSLVKFSSESRFRQGIIPFSGWSIIPYFFLAAALTNTKIRKYTTVCVILIVFWYAFHGERVEAIGFMALMSISYYHKNKQSKAALIKIGILGGVLIALFIAIGIKRAGASELTISNIIKNLIVQPTACDVTYVFNCAVDVWYRNARFSGITYLSYLINCIPFANDPYAFAVRIQDYYYTVGGGLFFAEPVANFGIGFSAVVSFIFLLFIFLIIKKTSKYCYLLYSTLCISVFRLAWYGLNYPIVAMLYFAPFVLFLNKVLIRCRRNDNRQSEF